MIFEAFEKHESNVCRYGKSFPAVFTKAKGATIWDEDGNTYIDFLIGSGALNYGHNHPDIIEPTLKYLAEGNILLSLDMYTEAKREFIDSFVSHILEPRNMDYKLQFPGPTGTNANEAAMALARKVTGRSTIFAFTNAFHGMSLGSLAVSGSASTRELGGVSRHDVVRMPYCNYPNSDADTASYLDAVLADPGSGYEIPAAIILETIQAEGGMNVASDDWLQSVQSICRKHNILLIVDDIQAGSGRTGEFFSFEKAELEPDIICLSKSLSGSGIPLSLVLIKPEHDIWKPGEHSGTFRGNNLAFVTAAATCSLWSNSAFCAQVKENCRKLDSFITTSTKRYPSVIKCPRGRGLMAGLLCKNRDIAINIHDSAFANGLLIKTSGANRDVIKLVPPINISRAELEQGLGILTLTFKEQSNE